MAKIVISGWNEGLQKICMTKLIQQNTALGLKASKSCTDAVLNGELVVLTVDSEHGAIQLARELEGLGAVVEAKP